MIQKIRCAVLDLLHIAGGTSLSSSNCLRLLIALLLVFTVPAFLHGQVDFGTIAGTVTDSTGSVIPSVVVMAAQVATGASQKTYRTILVSIRCSDFRSGPTSSASGGLMSHELTR
jgi:hypothetical protein